MSNAKKAKVLGMPLGTASNRLRKIILFDLVQQLELDSCFRCGEKIDGVENLSIEHKVSWQMSDNPVRLFFFFFLIWTTLLFRI